MPAKIARLSVCAVLLALGCSVPLSAQSVPDARLTADSMAAALKLRSSIAQAVAADTTRPEDALGQLREESSPTGLKVDPDADFAVAALDVGRRLLVARKPVEAESFFRAADASLGLVILRTPDSAARDKAQYLEIRAIIRTSYLNKLAEGKADLQEALKLAPGDKRLQQMRNLLPADPASTLSNHKELPARG